MSVLTMRAVSRRFGATLALDEVTLALAAGERQALAGHNGAGKTTLMKLLLGLCRPSAGRVQVFGHDPGGPGFARLRRRIGFVPENVRFDPAMTGREVLRFHARLKGAAPAQCEDALTRLGLAAAADRRIGTWSKGMRQRLGLAQALLGGPGLLLLDEPTSGLDPASRERLQDTIAAAAEAGTAVLLSSHLLAELEGSVDRIAIMRAGRVLAEGDLATLRARAGLPVQLNVTPAAAAAGEVAAALGLPADPAPPDGVLRLRCAAGEKMDLLRRISSLGDKVLDVDMEPPSLAGIYAHLHDGPGAT